MLGMKLCKNIFFCFGEAGKGASQYVYEIHQYISQEAGKVREIKVHVKPVPC